jgi:hypothetical protein
MHSTGGVGLTCELYFDFPSPEPLSLYLKAERVWQSHSELTCGMAR